MRQKKMVNSEICRPTTIALHNKFVWIYLLILGLSQCLTSGDFLDESSEFHVSEEDGGRLPVEDAFHSAQGENQGNIDTYLTDNNSSTSKEEKEDVKPPPVFEKPHITREVGNVTKLPLRLNKKPSNFSHQLGIIFSTGVPLKINNYEQTYSSNNTMTDVRNSTVSSATNNLKTGNQNRADISDITILFPNRSNSNSFISTRAFQSSRNGSGSRKLVRITPLKSISNPKVSHTKDLPVNNASKFSHVDILLFNTSSSISPSIKKNITPKNRTYEFTIQNEQIFKSLKQSRSEEFSSLNISDNVLESKVAKVTSKSSDDFKANDPVTTSYRKVVVHSSDPNNKLDELGTTSNKTHLEVPFPQKNYTGTEEINTTDAEFVEPLASVESNSSNLSTVVKGKAAENTDQEVSSRTTDVISFNNPNNNQNIEIGDDLILPFYDETESRIFKPKDKKNDEGSIVNSDNQTIIRVDVMTTSSEVNFKLFNPSSNISEENGTLDDFWDALSEQEQTDYLLEDEHQYSDQKLSVPPDSVSVFTEDQVDVETEEPAKILSDDVSMNNEKRKQGGHDGSHLTKTNIPFTEKEHNNSTKDTQSKEADNFESRSGRAPWFGRKSGREEEVTSSLNTELGQQSSLNLSDESSISSAGVAGIVLGIFFIIIIGAGVAVYVVYKRMEGFRPKILLSDRSCSNSESGGYLDDQCRANYMNSQIELSKSSPDDLVSLDNDSFLNSLESMTIQNLWTDTIRHTKL